MTAIISMVETTISKVKSTSTVDLGKLSKTLFVIGCSAERKHGGDSLCNTASEQRWDSQGFRCLFRTHLMRMTHWTHPLIFSQPNVRFSHAVFFRQK